MSSPTNIYVGVCTSYQVVNRTWMWQEEYIFLFWDMTLLKQIIHFDFWIFSQSIKVDFLQKRETRKEGWPNILNLHSHMSVRSFLNKSRPPC